MHNQPDVGADAHRAEVLVLGLVDLVELHPAIDRVELQVEGGCFDGFLLIAGQAGETVCKGVGYAEVHVSALPQQQRRSE